MNMNRNFVKGFVLTLALTAVTAGTVSAQDLQGKFNLPLQTRWALANLPAGNYSFEVTATQGGQHVVIVRSKAKGGPAVIIPLGATEPSRRTNKSALVCVRQGSILIVRALELGYFGETTYFRMPRGTRVYAQQRSGQSLTLVAEAPELIERVVVTTFQK